MKTSSFIGSNKNAGKTTVLNFILKKFAEEKREVIVTSIGINGEGTDHFIGKKKPYIQIYKNNLFVTEKEHLKKIQGLVKIIQVYSPPEFTKSFVLVQALISMDVILEGPNTKREILLLKTYLEKIYPHFELLIDGSIDRQFLGDPQISEKIYFSLLLTSGKEQQQKIFNYIDALNLPVFNLSIPLPESHFKSVLINTQGETLYLSQELSFLDEELIDKIRSHYNEELILVLQSALTDTLAYKLRSFKKIKIILENFTLVRMTKKIQLDLYLLKKTSDVCLFYKQDDFLNNVLLPPGIDIYREDLYEVRV